MKKKIIKILIEAGIAFAINYKKKPKVNTPKPHNKFVNYHDSDHVNKPKEIKKSEPKEGTKEAHKNVPQVRDDKHNPANVPEDKKWLEKVVRNPKTGNMVNVKSLPPELQKKYREQRKRKVRVREKLGR